MLLDMMISVGTSQRLMSTGLMIHYAINHVYIINVHIKLNRMTE